MKDNSTENAYLGPKHFDALKRNELNYINRLRGFEGDPLAGLALSGGGIRSATFNLGVLQALAKRGLLCRIDYLSTVSGGGYIGSSLTWFLDPSRQKDFAERSDDPALPFGTVAKNFPYGADEPGHIITGKSTHLQRDLLDHLRRRGNYLTPGDGYTILTLIAVVLRNAVISLMIWVPLISILMYLPMLFSAVQAKSIPPFYTFIGVLGLVALAIFSAGGAFMALIVTHVTNKGNDNAGLGIRSWVDKHGAKLLNVAIALIGIYIVAWSGIQSPLNTLTVGMSGGSVLIGIIASLTALFEPNSRLINKIFLPFASSILAFGLLLCAFHFAYSASLKQNLVLYGTIIRSDYLLYSSAIIAAALGMFANLNFITISRYYRDRLKEAYMPNAESLLPDRSNSAPAEVKLKDVCRRNDEGTYQGPYHIINANLILIDSKDSKRHRRGGDNFILSPLYCGGDATGWRRTSEFCNGDLTLGTAMAVSGAAVNPNTGPGGRGITRNRVVSFVMALLNLRLGIWLPNPNPKYERHIPPGNFLITSWQGIKSWMGGRGYHEETPDIQLSDGGHFENLGLYELLRRELKVIVVSDASADPNFTFADLRRALRFAETDLDVEISFDHEGGLRDLMPNEGNIMDSPMAEARKGYLHATIHYKSGKDGRLFYLKSTIIGGQRVRTKSYKLEYPRFPDQPTTDQFFDEGQFAAYRDLGYTITLDMLEHNDLHPLDRRRGNDRRRIERRREIVAISTDRRQNEQRRKERRAA